MELVRNKTISEPYTNSEISEMFRLGMLRKDHPLQRPSDQWEIFYRDGFISTVIKNELFDSIKVCEQLEKNCVNIWVIDGIQRLTTINQYKDGKFKLGKNIEKPIVSYQVLRKDENGDNVIDEDGNRIYDNVEFDIRGKGYDDLPEELQFKFRNCSVTLVKHLDCDDDEIGYHIRRYNHQKSMNANQTSITYMDSTAKKVKKLSNNHKFFRSKDYGNYSEKERKNGSIDRVVAESMMTSFHLDDWQKQGKNMGLYLNENATDEEFETLSDNLDRLEAVIDAENEGKLFTCKDSFIWIGLFNRFTELDVEDTRFPEFLKAFMAELHSKEIDGETYDSIVENRATKDKSVITKKIELLEKLMKEYFSVEDETKMSDEEFIVENVGLEVEDVIKDKELYEQTLDDLLENTVRMESKLRNPENRQSLLAMVAYSYNQDIDPEEWMTGYAKNNNTYFVDQKRNYLHMRKDLEEFMEQRMSA